MTILIGRNGSGISNALDALEVLSRLAEGGDLVDPLDSRRVEAGIWTLDEQLRSPS
ncbi:ATP-binding protein [Nonomuraea diastatica]|uniref:ATP-binding protein n=1 Tax=Nonomuraea diastatica TaxID=1848329 RepID=UPI0015F2CF87|nr:ATP-binding protein [Nonomuraea diastatica]